LSRAQQAFPMQTADADRHAGFGRRSGQLSSIQRRSITSGMKVCKIRRSAATLVGPVRAGMSLADDSYQRRPPNWKSGLRLFVTSAPPQTEGRAK
jgi:hypothetical protein